MLEKIQKVVRTKIGLDEKKWLFFSWFNSSWNLLFSNGILMSDKKLWVLVEDLVYWLLENYKKNIKILVCDVVLQLTEVTSYENIFNLSPKEYWFALVWTDWSSTWVILPNTEWVADAKNAFALIKQKNALEWKVKVYSFKTERMIVEFN